MLFPNLCEWFSDFIRLLLLLFPPSLLLSTSSFSLCLLCLSPPVLSWASLPLVPPLFLQPLLETFCSVRFKPVVFSEVNYPEGLGFPEHGNSFYSCRSLLHLQLRTTAKQQLYSAFASKCTLLRFKIFGSCDKAAVASSVTCQKRRRIGWTIE